MIEPERQINTLKWNGREISFNEIEKYKENILLPSNRILVNAPNRTLY